MFTILNSSDIIEEMNNLILAPSLLSADFSELKNAIKLIEDNNGKAVHIDVMDGIFVPQISYGEPVVKSIRHLTSLPFDVHLMIEHPENHIDSFAESGADWITFHSEAALHQHRIVEKIHSLGKKAGISICPSTPVSVLSEILQYVDLVLVMTVNPGFGGQSFIESAIGKVQRLREMIDAQGSKALIEVDGGVQSETDPRLVAAGVDVLVSGSYIFKAADPIATIKALKAL